MSMIIKIKNLRRDYIFRTSSTKIGGQKYPIIVLYHKETGIPVAYPKLERWYLHLIESKKLSFHTMNGTASAVCAFMNFILWMTPNEYIHETTLHNIRDFLEFFKETANGEPRDYDGWNRGIGYVYDFLMSYEKHNNDKFDFSYDYTDIYSIEYVNNSKRRKTVIRHKNFLSVQPPEPGKRKNRLLVHDYLNLLLQVASEYDPMLTFGLALQAYAGLREGEVVNVGRDRIHLIDGGYGRIGKIELDLNSLTRYAIEYNKTHKTDFGIIKKLRTQEIYQDFTEKMYKRYTEHEMLLNSLGYDDLYDGPLLFNEYGKPMSAKTYTGRLRTVFYDAFLPRLKDLCKNSGSWAVHAPFIESYEREYPGAHMCRHWFTMYLLERTDLSHDEISSWRGDKDPDSMSDYIHVNSNMILMYNNNAYRFQQSVLREIL